MISKDKRRPMKWAVAGFVFALAGIAWAFGGWAPLAVEIPVVFVKNDATGVEDIKAALLTGSDVIVREAASGSKENANAQDPSAEELDGACISYGAVPEEKRGEVEKEINQFLAMAARDIVALGEPTSARDQIEWHRRNETLCLQQAMLDMLVHGRAYVANGTIELPGHWSAGVGYGNLYIDESTGLAIDYPGRSRKESFLKLGDSVHPAPASVVFHVPFAEYRDLDFHRSERQRVQRELAIANVVSFNSHDFLERKRRYEEWRALKDEHRATKFHVYAEEKKLLDRMDELVPLGIRVRAKNRFLAEAIWR